MRMYNPQSLALRSWGMKPDVEYDLCFSENCDTIIDGMKYMRLSYQNTTAGEGFEIYNDFFKPGNTYSILREENGKVFAYSENTHKEHLIYDFTLDEGDEFSLEAVEGSGYYECKVERVSYIECNGSRLKRIRFSSQFTDHQYYEKEDPVVNEWTEELGGYEPAFQPPVCSLTEGGCLDIMAYVSYSDNTFLPVEFNSGYFKGQQLVLGEEITEELESDKFGANDLHYEFTDDFSLHVYGVIWTNYSPNQYIYCTIIQRGYDPIFDISLDYDILSPKSETVGAFPVDLYFNDIPYDVYSNNEFHINDNVGDHILYINTKNTKMIAEGMEYTYAGAATYEELTSHPMGGTFLEDVSFHGSDTKVINGKIYIHARANRGYTQPYLPHIEHSCSYDDFYTIFIDIREEDGIIYVPKEQYLKLFQGENYINMFEGDGSYIPYQETDDGELILYDFNMNVGDKYPSVPGHDDISVIATDSIETSEGLKRKRLTLSNGYIVVEDLGCVNSPGMFLCYLNPLHKEHYGTLLGYHDYINHNVVLFQYLIDATSIRQIKADDKQNGSVIYDLSGRRLTGIPEHGIYIQNGKKLIVR